jgi:formyltetrahydrofolate-dependent phosphoribosylglycinamide formyltransferase
MPHDACTFFPADLFTPVRFPVPPGPHKTPRLAVLISGGGRTLLNIQEQIRAGRLAAQIPLVIASKDSPGARRAREAGLHVEVVPGRIAAERLAGLLAAHAIDWVVLAGYLHLLDIPPAYRDRVVNIHPALLPRFGGAGMYGHHVHEAVLAAGDKVSGCTVHIADECYDRGRIVLQRTCPVLPGDTPDTLAARVFELELEAYPAALRELLQSGH